MPGDVAARADALIARGREEWQAYESALAVREREDQLADLDTAWRETPPPTASNPSAPGGLVETTAADLDTAWRVAGGGRWRLPSAPGGLVETNSIFIMNSATTAADHGTGLGRGWRAPRAGM